MGETCRYTHTGDFISDWECPHPATDGDFCLFHTKSTISRGEISDFSENDPERQEDGSIPAYGARAEKIPIDASTYPIDLREAETGITASETGDVSGFDLSGATLNRVDLAHTRITGDALLHGATIKELRLNQARVEEQFVCTDATVEKLSADGARFEMVCDFQRVTITDKCRLNGIYVDGILSLTESFIQCPLLLNKSTIQGDFGLADSTLQKQVLAEHLQVYGTCNSVGIVAEGVVTFRRSEFKDIVDFSDAKFRSEARFDMTTKFHGEVQFNNAEFVRRARFASAQFRAQADFNNVLFRDVASFSGAQFDSTVSFGQQAEFTEQANFDRARFNAGAVFDTAKIASGKFTAATCAGVLSIKNAKTGTLTLSDMELGNFECRQTTCNGRLQFEDAVISGNIDLSFSIFDGSVVLRGTSIRGDFSAINTTFEDELDCRETIISGIFRISSTENDPRRSSKTNIDGGSIKGGAGFVYADIETLIIEGIELNNPLFAEGGQFSHVMIDFANGSSAVVRLKNAEIQSGTISPPDHGNVNFDLEQAVLGPVTLESGSDTAAPLNSYWISRVEFQGFRFTEHRELLESHDWQLHGAPSEMSLSPTDLEVTYLAAKNGANEVGARNAAGEFFKQELRHRRQDHRNSISVTEFKSSFKPAIAWCSNKILDMTAVYGESPSRVFATAVLSIVAFSGFSLMLDPATLNISTLIQRTLLSIQAFTAFIFGQPEVPATVSLQFLTAIQAFLGAFLVGLFIFSLTRSVSR
jgi:uncharacterized protein YjbI with pentapeptide repeats